jgi:hypothetical protein
MLANEAAAITFKIKKNKKLKKFPNEKYSQINEYHFEF